jgi:hypothetical protein
MDLTYITDCLISWYVKIPIWQDDDLPTLFYGLNEYSQCFDPFGAVCNTNQLKYLVRDTIPPASFG